MAVAPKSVSPFGVTQAWAQAGECWQNEDCWVERHWSDAEDACARAIEERSHSSFGEVEWLTSWWGSIFRFGKLDDNIHPSERGSPSVYYTGDKVRFPNGRGGSAQMIYRCKYSPNYGVTSLTVRKGHFPR